jgi:hypothetical protein
MSRTGVKYVPQVPYAAAVILIHDTPEIGATDRDGSQNTLIKRREHSWRMRHSSFIIKALLHTSYTV